MLSVLSRAVKQQTVHVFISMYVYTHTDICAHISFHTDLMRLRRTTAASNKKGGEKEKKGEALISRQAPGMCFAFHPKVS